MLDVAIRSARVVRAAGIVDGDIGIDDGRFVAIGDGVGPARVDIDAKGLLALPALVDAHAHINEPGRTAWEGFTTGSAALAAGGGATLLDMPLNSEPPLLDASAFAAKRAALEATSIVDVGLWGGLTPDNVDRLEALAEAGVVGFKAFLSDSGIASFRAADDATLWRGMQVAASTGSIVAVHAENDAITGELARQARQRGPGSASDWTASRPPVAETEAIARVLHLAADTRARVHIVHVSTAEGATLVAEARRRGIDATCETCPHYLHFTVADAERLGTVLKCAPPLRDEEHRNGLWSALHAGHIDLIASDHSPAPPDLKASGDWFEVWGGIAGIQSTLPVLLDYVERGDLALNQTVRLTSEAPAKRFALDRKGKLAPGYDADVALVRREPSGYVLAAGDLHQRHPHSPYVGGRFRHRIVRTLRRGETIFADGRIAAHGGGRLVRPATMR